ncbi:MAG: hypothetical protein HND52_12150 [Ignavibacteriae bacterium]|nr:hypothetical protein [Ignavibacteriota bacterium]NOG98704.1 hypothetical protein [Ignavibacteriota bacterium]
MISFKNKYLTLASVVFTVLTINFIYAGVSSAQRMDAENCCLNMVEETSCCMVEPEVVANPSCHLEAKPAAESMSNCGCIHDNPISDTSVLLKDNVELLKTFASTIDYQNDVSAKTYSSSSIKDSFKFNYNSSPIYIINSSFLI